jgi:hypothetical protein
MPKELSCPIGFFLAGALPETCGRRRRSRFSAWVGDDASALVWIHVAPFRRAGCGRPPRTYCHRADATLDNCFASFSTKAGSLNGWSLMSCQRTQACASMRKCRATAGCRNRYTDRRLPVAARDRELPLRCLASRTLRVLSIASALVFIFL